MGDGASLTNLNAGRDKILFYYRRINCAIKILFGRKKGREDAWFCYIFAGIGDDSGIISFSWVNFLCK